MLGWGSGTTLSGSDLLNLLFGCGHQEVASFSSFALDEGDTLQNTFAGVAATFNGDT